VGTKRKFIDDEEEKDEEEEEDPTQEGKLA
jgi:hypothetical protein